MRTIIILAFGLIITGAIQDQMDLPTDLSAIAALAPGEALAQVGSSISADGSAPNNNAMLDVQSPANGNGKGLLIPRVTLAQRTTASSSLAGGLLDNSGNLRGGAAQGLIVYQTDGVQGLYYNTSQTATPAWLHLGEGSDLNMQGHIITNAVYYGDGRGITNLSAGAYTETDPQWATASNSVVADIATRLASNVWAAAGSTTNYLPRTGGTMSGALNMGAQIVSNVAYIDFNADAVSVGRGANGSSSGAAVGFGANGYNESAAVGGSANGTSEGAALGFNANGNSSGAAMGWYANGSGSGAAVGWSAAGTNTGTAVGNQANGSSSGAAVGGNANSYYYGAVVGRQANGFDFGAVVGYLAIGTNRGAAVGRQANGSTYGAAMGYSANATDFGVAVGYLSIGTNYGVAVGEEAVGSASGVAMGYQADGSVTGVAVGGSANGYKSGVAVGYQADGSVTGVAVGVSANGYDRGAAMGYQANGYYYGAAVGYQANGYNGVALGNQANGFLAGAALGWRANATNYGAAMGAYANGSIYGTVMGFAATGTTYGIALGWRANGTNYGTAVGLTAVGATYGAAVGYQANGAQTNVAIGMRANAQGGTQRIAIGNNVTNEVNDTTALRGTLYLDGGTGINYRATFGSGAWANKAFEIDHPLDPENKILRHFCLEGPQVWNLYAGNAQLVNGSAVVHLPEYYSALNLVGSEIYSLTPVGGWAPIWVQAKVSDNVFVIAGQADLEVSWSIKVLRNDPACREDLRRRPVEQLKREIR